MVIDSGASAHMSPHHKLFTCFTPFPDPRQVTLGNGKATHATGSGTIQLTDLLRLDHVLCVPDLACNLLSVSTAVKAGVECAFSSGLCTLSKAGYTLFKATLSDCALYTFQASVMPDEQKFPLATANVAKSASETPCCGTASSATWALTTLPNCPTW